MGFIMMSSYLYVMKLVLSSLPSPVSLTLPLILFLFSTSCLLPFSEWVSLIRVPYRRKGEGLFIKHGHASCESTIEEMSPSPRTMNCL